MINFKLAAHSALIGDQRSCDAIMSLSEEDRVRISKDVEDALVEAYEAGRKDENKACAQVADERARFGRIGEAISARMPGTKESSK